MDMLKKIPFDGNQAVVFDIDDTLISSRNHKIIPHVYKLYQYCLQKGYSVYIITARPNINHVVNYTHKQLTANGITGYKKIYFRPPLDMNIGGNKLKARRDIKEKIVMSVGDMRWDVQPEGGIGLLVVH